MQKVYTLPIFADYQSKIITNIKMINVNIILDKHLNIYYLFK